MHLARAFAGTWNDAGTIVIDEALTVLLHDDDKVRYGFATHQGDDLSVKYFNGAADKLRLVNDNGKFDDQIHSRKYGNLMPFGEVADFVGEWIDDEFELFTIEEGISGKWTRKDGVTETSVREVRGDQLSLRRDDRTIVFRLVDGVFTNRKYGRFSK